MRGREILLWLQGVIRTTYKRKVHISILVISYELVHTNGTFK